MVVYNIELDIHAANGEETTYRYMYDNKRNTLIQDVIDLSSGLTKYVYLVTDKLGIKEIQKVLANPNDPQRHPSGYFIKEARIKETPLSSENLETLLQLMKE